MTVVFHNMTFNSCWQWQWPWFSPITLTMVLPNHIGFPQHDIALVVHNDSDIDHGFPQLCWPWNWFPPNPRMQQQSQSQADLLLQCTLAAASELLFAILIFLNIFQKLWLRHNFEPIFKIFSNTLAAASQLWFAHKLNISTCKCKCTLEKCSSSVLWLRHNFEPI